MSTNNISFDKRLRNLRDEVLTGDIRIGTGPIDDIAQEIYDDAQESLEQQRADSIALTAAAYWKWRFDNVAFSGGLQFQTNYGFLSDKVTTLWSITEDELLAALRKNAGEGFETADAETLLVRLKGKFD